MKNLFRRWTKRIHPRSPSPYPLCSHSGRLSLRPLTDDETELVREWFRDRQTCELAFGVQAPWDVLSTIRTEYIDELQKDKVGVLSIRILDPGESLPTVGFVRYKIFRKGNTKSARVGIVLGPPEIRGKGVGREALQTLIGHLFSEREIRLIELDTALFNTPAQNCFLACGFKPVREAEFSSISAQWTERRLMMKLTYDEWVKSRLEEG